MTKKTKKNSPFFDFFRRKKPDNQRYTQEEMDEYMETYNEFAKRENEIIRAQRERAERAQRAQRERTEEAQRERTERAQRAQRERTEKFYNILNRTVGIDNLTDLKDATYNVDLNMTNGDGQTILHIIPYLFSNLDKQNKALEYFLAKGADPNAQDNRGKTPIWEYYLNDKAVETLVNAGADNRPNVKGVTPGEMNMWLPRKAGVRSVPLDKNFGDETVLYKNYKDENSDDIFDAEGFLIDRRSYNEALDYQQDIEEDKEFFGRYNQYNDKLLGYNPYYIN